MREITVINPAAGSGNAPKGRSGYMTTGVGDCRRFVRSECEKDPDVHFDICGGDGTLNEAISGIIDAGACDRASFTAIPCGSGNDTVKTADLYRDREVVPLDAITINGGYAINMINIGFDCNVVSSAEHFKKKWKIAGKLSYLLGVMKEFFGHFGEPFTVRAECEDGSVFEQSEEAMLCAVCNGQWCGGSFHNSPLSDMTDGVLEMLLVRKMSRFSFLRMIGKYKKGTLVDRESGAIIPEMRKYVVLKKIRKLTLTGCRRVCSDGEIYADSKAEIGVLPGAVRYRAAAKK